MGKKRSRGGQAYGEEPPEGCYLYTTYEELPWDCQKYWYQRHSIFSKYDEGIWMTEDGWFGVTPEPVADKIAGHVESTISSEKSVLIDAFAGVGGNSIAFAKSGRWETIYAIEKDAATLACAKHNAELYGVAEMITWVQGDCFEAIPTLTSDIDNETVVIFASPPWGGPGYKSDKIFNLLTMQPYPLDHLMNSFLKITQDIILYLPRTSNLLQLTDYVYEEKNVKVMHYCMEGASKALCAYFGSFEWPEQLL